MGLFFIKENWKKLLMLMGHNLKFRLMHTRNDAID